MHALTKVSGNGGLRRPGPRVARSRSASTRPTGLSNPVFTAGSTVATVIQGTAIKAGVGKKMERSPTIAPSRGRPRGRPRSRKNRPLRGMLDQPPSSRNTLSWRRSTAHRIRSRTRVSPAWRLRPMPACLTVAVSRTARAGLRTTPLNPATQISESLVPVDESPVLAVFAPSRKDH
jgi:hypothetical protein